MTNDFRKLVEQRSHGGSPSRSPTSTLSRVESDPLLQSLKRAATASRLIETADNYSRADDPLRYGPEIRQSDSYPYAVYDEGDFWHSVFGQPETWWGRKLEITLPSALSEWVARVPGLYWKPESAKMRELTDDAIEMQSARWITYTPQGKSQKVLGGVGTLRLAASADGYRLATLALGLNVSAGIPALIAPDVWEYHRLGEGSLVRGRGRWQAMASEWSSHFPSIRGIPRGCLVIDTPSDLEVDESDVAPTLLHPFTIMEYYQGNAEYFDYVFASADTGDARYRQELEVFFDGYRRERGRLGTYLLAGDIANPLWDAQYDSPAALRRADAAAESELNLLEERIRRRMLGDDTIETLLQVLGRHVDSVNELKQLSDEIGFPSATWFRGGTVAEGSNQLIDTALQHKKLDALVEVCMTRFS